MFAILNTDRGRMRAMRTLLSLFRCRTTPPDKRSNAITSVLLLKANQINLIFGTAAADIPEHDQRRKTVAVEIHIKHSINRTCDDQDDDEDGDGDDDGDGPNIIYIDT